MKPGHGLPGLGTAVTSERLALARDGHPQTFRTRATVATICANHRKGGRASIVVGNNRADLPLLLASQGVGRAGRLGARRLAPDSDCSDRRGTLAGGVQIGASISLDSRSSASFLTSTGSTQEVKCASLTREAAIPRSTIPSLSGYSRIVLSSRKQARSGHGVNDGSSTTGGPTVASSL